MKANINLIFGYSNNKMFSYLNVNSKSKKTTVDLVV